MNARDKEIWEKSQQWDSSDDGRGKLKILESVEKFADLIRADKPVLQDIEQYRLQIAGICTAAIGYWKEGDGIHPEYDTLALRDVAKLYSKYDELYRAQPAQRNPLTDDEMWKMWNAHGTDAMNQQEAIAFARAIEAAHNIKEKTT